LNRGKLGIAGSVAALLLAFGAAMTQAAEPVIMGPREVTAGEAASYTATLTPVAAADTINIAVARAAGATLTVTSCTADGGITGNCNGSITLSGNGTASVTGTFVTDPGTSVVLAYIYRCAAGSAGDKVMTATGTGAIAGTDTQNIDCEAAVNEISFQSVHSDKCIDVWGYAFANGATVVQWTCNSADNQRLNRIDLGNGWFALRFEHSDRCLDVAGEDHSWGAPIIQWDCHYRANQQWRYLASDPYVLQVRHSFNCANVAGASRRDAAQIWQWGCHLGDDEKWTIDR
jgi:hypothetical protein